MGDFAYFDPENGNDRGRGIRTLTKQIFDLLKDRNALEKLREDAHKQRSKLQGINATSVSSGGYGGAGSSGFGSSGGGASGGGSGGYNSNYSGNSYKNRSYEEEARDWKYGSSYDPYDKSKGDDDDKKSKKKKKKKKSKKKKKRDSSDEETESEREPTPK